MTGDTPRVNLLVASVGIGVDLQNWQNYILWEVKGQVKVISTFKHLIKSFIK